MHINGPFKLAVVESQDALGHGLHLYSTQGFCALGVADQASATRRYLAQCQPKILDQPGDSADRQGVLAIQQVVEQLLPHIAAGEILVGKTMVIQITPGSIHPRVDSSPATGP
jgi:hypothetical protein